MTRLAAIALLAAIAGCERDPPTRPDWSIYLEYFVVETCEGHATNVKVERYGNAASVTMLCANGLPAGATSYLRERDFGYVTPRTGVLVGWPDVIELRSQP